MLGISETGYHGKILTDRTDLEMLFRNRRTSSTENEVGTVSKGRCAINKQGLNMQQRLIVTIFRNKCIYTYSSTAIYSSKSSFHTLASFQNVSTKFCMPKRDCCFQCVMTHDNNIKRALVLGCQIKQQVIQLTLLFYCFDRNNHRDCEQTRTIPRLAKGL